VSGGDHDRAKTEQEDNQPKVVAERGTLAVCGTQPHLGPLNCNAYSKRAAATVNEATARLARRGGLSALTICTTVVRAKPASSGAAIPPVVEIALGSRLGVVSTTLARGARRWRRGLVVGSPVR
jgi:hypothetical protein